MNAAFDNIGSLQTQAPGTSRCPLPSLAPDDRDFRQDGAYWRGSVWLPTAYMAVKADGFYYDILESDRSKVKVRTIASFWPLLARMATPPMAERLLAKLRDPAQFGCVSATALSDNAAHAKETGA